MTPDQVRLVQSSFSTIQPIKKMAAELFYARLFQIAPELEALFKGDPKEQGEKLMHALAVAVQALEERDPTPLIADDFASQDVTFGETPAMCRPVGAALIWTLERGLGEAFTPEIRAAWEAACDMLAPAMVEIAYPKMAAE
ncbi:MAG: globin domain-containing protein [Pseudomonadota bacterium]